MTDKKNPSPAKLPMLMRFRLRRYMRTGVLKSSLAQGLLRHEHLASGEPERTTTAATPGELVVRSVAAEDATRVLAKGAQSQDKTATQADELRTKARAARREARLVPAAPAIDQHGGRICIADAITREQTLGNTIEAETRGGSQSHLRVHRRFRRLVLFAPVLDFPLLLWFISSEFNVPWQRNWLGIPFVVSVVFALFATVVAAVVLHKVGKGVRPYKTADRELHWDDLQVSAKIRLGVAAAITSVLAAVMFTRIYSEASQAGTGLVLTVVLALLLAVLAFASNALVAWVAFLDGSTDTDALDHYATITRAAVRRQQQLEAQAAGVDERVEELKRVSDRAKIRTEGKASVPLRGADRIIALHYTLNPTAAPTVGEIIDPNTSAGAVGHHPHDPRIHPDHRALTTAAGHVQTGAPAPAADDHLIELAMAREIDLRDQQS